MPAITFDSENSWSVAERRGWLTAEVNAISWTQLLASGHVRCGGGCYVWQIRGIRLRRSRVLSRHRCALPVLKLLENKENEDEALYVSAKPIRRNERTFGDISTVLSDCVFLSVQNICAFARSLLSCEGFRHLVMYAAFLEVQSK